MRIVHRPSPVPLFVLLFSLILAPTAYGVTVEQVHTPRPKGWVVDLTATLSSEALAELNRLGDEVKAQTGAEMAVVVVFSTDGIPSREFATRLFNTWHIGNRRKNNGVLVFAALADRKAEILLGRGINDSDRIQESEAVMQNEMVPRFRGGDPTGALLHGMAACAQRILKADVALQEPAVAATPAEAVPSPSPAVQPIPETAPQPGDRFAAPLPSPVPSTPQFIVPPEPSESHWVLWGTVLLGAVGLVAFKLRPVRCPQCKGKMKRDTSGEPFLEPSEQMEENIGSVHYELWVCPACGQKKKTRQRRAFSGYKACPSCSALTLETTRTTVRKATYSHGGTVREDDKCLCCSYHHSSSYSTPMLEDRSSSYSSSSSSSSSSSTSSSASAASLFSSSGSSSGSSSSSSGSSSDSGFSGGSSSGSGASGSW